MIDEICLAQRHHLNSKEDDSSYHLGPKHSRMALHGHSGHSNHRLGNIFTNS